MEAQGQAQAVELLAKAQAQALKVISEQLNQPGGQEAARLALASEYSKMYGEMGKQSNTILFNDRPADVNALLAQAMTAMQAASSSTAQPAIAAGETPAAVDAAPKTTSSEKTTTKTDKKEETN